ncbi:MAG: hypothetical protein ABIJ16_13010 [Bacteroidota bacterium]
MKKYTIFIVGFLIIIALLDSCKKGENDPFFSIRSRKARVVADWDIDSKSSIILYVLDNGQTAKVDFEISGKTSVTEVVDSINTPKDTSKTRNGEVYEGYYHFNKDGSMEYILHYTLIDDSTETDENTGETRSRIITTIYKTRASGTWNFMAGIDDYKNKERIAMVWENYNYSVNVISRVELLDDAGEMVTGYPISSSTFSAYENKYANGERAEVWEINQLKNKEIIIMRDIDDISVYADDNLGTKMTGSGTESITLTRE